MGNLSTVTVGIIPTKENFQDSLEFNSFSIPGGTTDVYEIYD